MSMHEDRRRRQSRKKDGLLLGYAQQWWRSADLCRCCEYPRHFFSVGSRLFSTRACRVRPLCYCLFNNSITFWEIVRDLLVPSHPLRLHKSGVPKFIEHPVNVYLLFQNPESRRDRESAMRGAECSTISVSPDDFHGSYTLIICLRNIIDNRDARYDIGGIRK